MRTTVPDPSGRPPSILTRDVILLLAAGTSYFIVVGTSFPVLPRLVERRLGGDEFDIGLAFAMLAVGTLLTRPYVGYLSDKVGRRPLMISGALAVAVIQFAYVPAADLGLWAVLLVRLLQGVAASAMYLAQATTATELPPHQRSAEIFSIFGVAVFVGFAIGPVLGEWTLEAAGFTAAFAVSGAFALLAALIGLALPETRPGDVEPTLGGFRSMLHPVAARAGVVSFLVIGSFIAFNGFVAPYGESLGIDQVRWALLSYSGTTLVVRLVAGRLINTVDRRALGTAAHLMAASGLGVIVAFQAPWAIYVGGVVLAAGLSFNVPLMTVIAADSAAPHERSRVVATVVVFSDLANSLSALVLGAVASTVGYRGMYGVVLAFTLGAAVLYRSRFMAPVTGMRGPISPSTPG